MLCKTGINKTFNIKAKQVLRTFVVLPVFALICYVSVQAQVDGVSGYRVSVHVKDMPLRNVLTIIEQQVAYKFAFDAELVSRQKPVTVDITDESLDEAIRQVLKGTNISYSIIDKQIVLREVPPRITLSGYVRDSLSGESLPAAIIYFPEKGTGTTTNDYGFYSVTLNKTDSMVILVSYLGFNKIYRRVGARVNSMMNFYMTESNIPLDKVLFTSDNSDDNIKRTTLGKTNVSLQMLRKVSSISGSGDIINTIQLLPGVMAGLDGRPGYFIRGGNTDQNLVQLDEATLYNPNHMLGLVSIFNSSAIKSAYLLKAGFPASFGDHLSSVLDVTMKDGNDQQLEGSLQLGTIASDITLSGPIVKDKASFLISARRSTIDYLLKPFDFTDYFKNYNFYDVDAKLSVRISQKDRLYLSLYQGKDNSSYSTDSTSHDSTSQHPINYELNYGNRAIALRWNHVFSQKIFSNTSLIYNNYQHDVRAKQGWYYAELYSGIRDIDLKTDLYFYPNLAHSISAGVSYLYQRLIPATVGNKASSAEPEITLDPEEIPSGSSNRLAMYLSDEIRLGPKFKVYLGARMPVYLTGDAQYWQVEPRLALLRILSPTTSIKLSYTHMHQYLNLVQSYNAAFPAEVWIGTDKMVKPQNSQEASLGLFRNFRDNMFQTSLEAYYKHMGNQVLFRGGLNPAITSDLDSLVIFGQGQSYGAELYIGKSRGNLTGWLSYTLSYAEQQFDSLNLGHTFPSANDRRHSLYISANYALNEHWSVSSNFILTSGRAFTLFKNVTTKPYDPLFYDNVTGEYEDGSTEEDNRVQNNYRLSPYNRLDLSIRYTKTRDLSGRAIESEWVFSVYNVYARRKNPFFAYCSIDPVTKKPMAVEVSFVPVIPSLSYSIRF